MTSIDIGNFYITNEPFATVGDTLSDSYTIVRIDHQKLDDNITKETTELNIPATQSSVPPSSLLLDLKRIKQVISVQGVLISDSTESAFEKKQKLYTLAGMGGNTENSFVSGQTAMDGFVTCVWGLASQSRQQKIRGNIVKIAITEVPGLIVADVNESHPITYSVQIQISIGKNMRTKQ